MTSVFPFDKARFENLENATHIIYEAEAFTPASPDPVIALSKDSMILRTIINLSPIYTP